ncbi:hypothetical protein V1527DRAFT_475366 [Lipomyces starkeyi]
MEKNLWRLGEGLLRASKLKDENLANGILLNEQVNLLRWIYLGRLCFCNRAHSQQLKDLLIR